MKHSPTQKTLPWFVNCAAQAALLPFQYLSSVQAELLVALTDLQSNWRITGAIAPSSRSLSSALASMAQGADQILELGAGTGAVTQELFKLFPSRSIQAVELQSRLATELKRKYPALNVVEGTAAAALDTYRRDGVTAVVSSLPFRSLPTTVRIQTVQSICQYLNESPGSYFIQFTYGLRQPFEVQSGFRWMRVKWIVGNLPPACIWLLTPIAGISDSLPRHIENGR
jgi:phosphatidylethanolamine/phosphatidyl-N-methylethanolamine N-methyltransferase